MLVVQPNLFRLVSVATLALVALIPIQTFGQSDPSDQNELRHRIVSDDSVVYLNWASLADLKATGSPSEDWLGQEEIQGMLKKLFKAIEEYQQLHPIDDELMNELLSKAPKLLYDCPATLHLTGYDEAHPDWTIGQTVFVVKLNQHTEYVEKTIERLIRKNKDIAGSVEQHEIDGVSMQSIPVENVGRTYFGIIEGNLVCSVGAIPIEETLANIKTPTPDFIKQNSTDLGVKRPYLNLFADADSLLKTWESEIPPGVYDTFKLDEIKSVSASYGLDDGGFIASFLVECPKELTGILSAFDGKQIQDAQIAEMPNNSISSAGARIPIANIFQQFNSSAKLSGAEEVFAFEIERIENLTGLKFSEEILDSFDGTIFAYQKLNNTSIVSLGVKDKDVFADRLAKAMKAIQIEAEAVEGGEFIKKQSKSFTIYSFKRPIYLGPSFSWCHADDQFYVGASANTISSHLRRRGRTRGRLIDDERFKEAMNFGESKGWGRPMVFSHVDIVTTMQLLIPLGRTFFGNQKLEDFDFSFDDVPSVEVLSNGVQSNVLTVFRTPKGIQAIERSTIPGLTSVGTTGVMIGMLLPAVQQVRAAARRATAMNNLRQLQFSILNYESAHGRFPRAHSADDGGKPLLSWRVHVLPYLEEKALYEKFHLDEPWDSPHNIKLLDQMPESFQNPSNIHVSGKTTFLAVTGEHGAFPNTEGLALGDIADGVSNTISIVDVNPKHAVNWTQPADFDPADHKSLLGPHRDNTLGTNVLVVLLDGSVYSLITSSEANLRQMMHRNDGKGSPEDE